MLIGCHCPTVQTIRCLTFIRICLHCRSLHQSLAGFLFGPSEFGSYCCGNSNTNLSTCCYHIPGWLLRASVLMARSTISDSFLARVLLVLQTPAATGTSRRTRCFRCGSFLPSKAKESNWGCSPAGQILQQPTRPATQRAPPVGISPTRFSSTRANPVRRTFLRWFAKRPFCSNISYRSRSFQYFKSVFVGRNCDIRMGAFQNHEYDDISSVFGESESETCWS